MAFSKSTEHVQTRLNRITEKARLKQSVVDMKKLQGYLEHAKTDKNLNQTLTRTARYDQEFNDFLTSFKEKNKEYANIIDLSHYARDQNLTKNQQMREEEIMMLEEFRKRKQDKTLYLDSDDEGASKLPKKKKPVDEDLEDDETAKAVDPKRFTRHAMATDNQIMIEKRIERKMKTLYKKESFLIVIMDRGLTTLVTTLSRINHFRYLVFMGNMNGVIGYGTGKGGNFEIALHKAIKNCKKNLIAIPLDHLLTLTAPIEVHNNGMTLYLEPRGDTNAWGSPIVANLLMLAGVHHFRFTLVSRNPDAYNMIYCLFKALTRGVTPKDMAERGGFKLFHQSYMPYKYFNLRDDVKKV